MRDLDWSDYERDGADDPTLSTDRPPEPGDVGIVNAAMAGMQAAPGEYVDWSTPDYATTDEWRYIVGQSIEDYAAANLHLIVFVHEDES